VEDVVQQDEVVAVLKKTIAGSDVSIIKMLHNIVKDIQ